MDMMNAIAGQAMTMQQSRIQQAYSTTLMKNSMDSAEAQAAKLLEMLPATSAPSPYGFEAYA